MGSGQPASPPGKPLLFPEVPPEFTRPIASPAALRLLNMSAGLMSCTSRARRAGDGGDRREVKWADAAGIYDVLEELLPDRQEPPNVQECVQEEPHTSMVSSVFLKCAVKAEQEGRA